MESAGQYLLWHPTSRVGRYSYSRLRSLWDSVCVCVAVPWAYQAIWHERMGKHSPPETSVERSRAELMSAQAESFINMCAFMRGRHKERPGLCTVCVTPQTQTCSVSAPRVAGPQTLALTVQAARGGQNLISEPRGFTHECHCSSIRPTQPPVKTPTADHLSYSSICPPVTSWPSFCRQV